jgi:hypothetical protein
MRRSLPIILLCAVIQGWVLYALHFSIKDHHWPATNPAWLLAVYSVVVLIPVMVQLLAAEAMSLLTWIMVASVTAALFYFGWFHGTSVAGMDVEHFAQYGTAFPLAFELVLFWLVLLPFCRCVILKAD